MSGFDLTVLSQVHDDWTALEQGADYSVGQRLGDLYELTKNRVEHPDQQQFDRPPAGSSDYVMLTDTGRITQYTAVFVGRLVVLLWARVLDPTDRDDAEVLARVRLRDWLAAQRRDGDVAEVTEEPNESSAV